MPRLYREILNIALIVFVIFAFRSSIVDWYEIPTGSMKPTIIEGDRVFVNKLAYDLRIPFTNIKLGTWADPQRGEIIVFNSPIDGHRLIKRVIGLPGDIIELHDNVLYINGVNASYRIYDQTMLQIYWEQDEEPENYVLYRETFAEHPHLITVETGSRISGNYGPVRIQEGHYFMMGDNRDNSADSRYIGHISRDLILGRASRVFYSLSYPSRSFKSLD